MSSYITSIGTAVPEYKIDQPNAAGWMADALEMNQREKKIVQALYDSSGILSRYSVLQDYQVQKGHFSFYPNTSGLEPFPTVKHRMMVYREQALPLALKAIENCFQKTEPTAEKISHLIVVSCTGMYAPGLDIEIIEKLGLSTHIERTSIQFMGCYAAFNALKSADYIAKSSPEAVVLIVCIELCTLHFQKQYERDHLVSNALFGDGAAAMLVEGRSSKGISLAMESFYCDISSHGRSAMAWHIANHGFEMTLSSYVPHAIKGGIRQLAESLLQRMKLKLGDVDYYAIHPGGRRILEVVEEELGLSPEDNCHAYETLRDYGNMSSPTVVFVINSIMKNLTEADHQKKLLSFAFGPGLTLESMLLNVHYA